jgi:hypothetical protein
MNWFEGNFTRNSNISWEKRWFHDVSWLRSAPSTNPYNLTMAHMAVKTLNPQFKSLDDAGPPSFRTSGNSPGKARGRARQAMPSSQALVVA